MKIYRFPSTTERNWTRLSANPHDGYRLVTDPADTFEERRLPRAELVEWLRSMADALDTCACGKPAAHLNADPDSTEWACHVPAAERAPQRQCSDHGDHSQHHYADDRLGTVWSCQGRGASS